MDYVVHDTVKQVCEICGKEFLSARSTVCSFVCRQQRDGRERGVETLVRDATSGVDCFCPN